MNEINKTKEEKERGSKLLASELMKTMSALAEGKIDTDEAKAYASLAKQYSNLLRYELDRAKTIDKIGKHHFLGIDESDEEFKNEK